jgi:hypothetical protein
VVENEQVEIKPQRKWKKFLVLVPIVLVLGVGIVLIKNWWKKVKTPTPSPPTQSNDYWINDLVRPYISYIKEGKLYVTDLSGEKQAEVLDLSKLEDRPVSQLNMKFSPDGKYIAYIGLSGGMDSSIKVIDILKKKLIYQDVYGSAEVVDFSWSLDSKKLAVAVDLKNEERNFSSTLYIEDVFAETPQPMNPQFNDENIEITKVEWVSDEAIYYSRISYTPQLNLGIVKFNPLTRDRQIKVLEDNSLKVPEETIGFIVSPDKTNLFVFTEMLNPAVSHVNDLISERLTLPDLEQKSTSVTYIPRDTSWVDNYLVGVEQIYSASSSSVVAVNTENSKRISLSDMGAMGKFHTVSIVHGREQNVAVVWLESRGKQGIFVYNVPQCMELRDAGQDCQPRWKMDDVTSPAL